MLNSELKTDLTLSEAIIRVIVFFDLFDYPLSAPEIKKYLTTPATLTEIIQALTGLKEIEEKNGFFFLNSRSEILATRQKRHNYSLRKIKIASRFSRMFSLLPWVKTIILSNSIGQFNLRDGSDIDFFIITAKQRIWLTRLFCAGIAALLNSRPSAKDKRDKICLSFYITTANLDLDNLKLPAGDPYFFYWLRSFILLYNKDNVYERFLAVNEISPLDSDLRKIDAREERPGLFFNFFENITKKFQLMIMSPALKQAINNSVGVVVSDKVLKLYLRDNRLEYAEKYGNKICQVFAKGN
jgi:hypothetical protein